MEFGLLRGQWRLTPNHGQVKLEQGKMFTYGRMRNEDYEDNESNNLILDVQSIACKRRVVVDETNLVVKCYVKIRTIDLLCYNRVTCPVYSHVHNYVHKFSLVLFTLGTCMRTYMLYCITCTQQACMPLSINI